MLPKSVHVDRPEEAVMSGKPRPADRAPDHDVTRCTFCVPTFYPSACDGDEPFGEPAVPIVAYEQDGLRVILGSDDTGNETAPDIHIERRRNGWAIFLHPVGDGDPSGYVYFLDDGRSFVVPDGGSTPAIAVQSFESVTAELD